MAKVEVTSVEKDALITEQAMQILNLKLSLAAHVRVIGELEASRAATDADKKELEG